MVLLPHKVCHALAGLVALSVTVTNAAKGEDGLHRELLDGGIDTMKNQKWWIFGLFVIAALVVGIRLQGGYKFKERTLNDQQNILQELGTRTTLSVNTTSQEGLLGVVGLVLIVDKNPTRKGPLLFDRTNLIPTFRPPAEAILVARSSKTIYDGAVSNTVNVGGEYTSLSGNLANNQTAEILIVDEVYMGYRDRTKIPFDQLYKLTPPEGKAYYFVEGATLASTTYRTFDEVSSTGSLEGSAFKANGKVYASSKGFDCVSEKAR